MSEGNETNDTNSGGRRPLTLRKTVDSGTVRQSFSHGRSKAVVVEKKRRRVVGPKSEAAAAEPKTAKPAEEAPETPKPVKAAAPAPKREPKRVETAAPAPKRSGQVLRELSAEERKIRAEAVKKAKAEEQVRRQREEEEAKERAKRAADEVARLEETRRQQAEDEARREKEAEERRQAEEEARRALEAEEEARRSKKQKPVPAAAASPEAKPADPAAAPVDPDDPFRALGGRIKTKRPERADDSRSNAKSKADSRRRTGKLTIAKALDEEERQRSLASVRRAREREKQRAQSRSEPQRIVREVVIPETITVQELAQRMAVRAVDLIKILMKQGQMVTANAVLDADTAQLVAEEMGHAVKRVAEADVEEGLVGADDEEETLITRPPVVTIMGHVDHGKTSLLDALRQTDVVKGEAGGITQHIGAYQITMADDQKITFLDTPGHAAFTAMRARGAKVTDIVVLVVAADDGVMPQTEEAINHAKAAEVPIIVAVNKIDKPEANPDRVRNDLLRFELVTESMGGDIQDIEVSALQKKNLDKLEEAILLQAELLELKANPGRAAEGAVVEARLDKGRGAVATLLVGRGTLKKGDIVIAGSAWGKIRALMDDKGRQLTEAAPAMPVEVLGLGGVPEPGDQFVVVDSEARAREVAEFRERRKRDKDTAASSRTSLEQMMAQLKDTEIKELPIIVKGDVQGSLEAIVGALEKMSTEEVRAKVVLSGVGGVSESDVIFAQATGAPIIGFNVRANKAARDAAEAAGVEIRYYSVIYDLVDDVKAALSGLLTPEQRETFLGNAEILEVFNISKFGKVAGCRVSEGKVERGAKVRLIRDSIVIHEGELSQLKRFKDDVSEVPAGQECGMSFANYEDLKPGDVIECFRVEEIQRTL